MYVLQLKGVNLFIFVKAITALRNDYFYSQPLYDKGFFQLEYRAMVHFSIKKVETTFE